MSRRSAKEQIAYLRETDRRHLYDELRSISLATYRYRGEAAGRHLGFIIDDRPGSPAVDASGNAVDLYAYLSMAVAAIQVQSREIAALKHEVDNLRRSQRAPSRRRR